MGDAQAQWLKQRWYLRDYAREQWAHLGDDPEKTVAWVFDSYGGSLAPLQSRAELTEFAHIVKRHSPRVVVEIGTARGGTLFVLCRMAADDAKIISIDLPAGAGGAGYPEWKLPILHSFAQGGQTLTFLRADSHADETIESVRKELAGQEVDLLFIDGDHSYDGALSDFRRYSRLVRPGGLICMHDVVPNPSTQAIEVDKVWEQVSGGAQAQVIRDPANLSKFGIGVLVA
jgi:predicted O-methyltransferase YrrM